MSCQIHVKCNFNHGCAYFQRSSSALILLYPFTTNFSCLSSHQIKQQHECTHINLFLLSTQFIYIALDLNGLYLYIFFFKRLKFVQSAYVMQLCGISFFQHMFQGFYFLLHVGLLIYTLNLCIITIGWPPWVGPMRASSPYSTVPFPSVTDILRDHKSTKNKPTS